MNRLRQSLRASIKRKKDRSLSLDPSIHSGCNNEDLPDNSKPNQFQIDDVAVRSGLCNFQVKYLGCVEVFNSRGMEVCEEAVKALKSSKRKSIRSVLYVSGDGLRVVDDETRGLILDQTIEKVSFCAPDRNYDRGFSYICRDGTTRRWMCHGFMACKDSGERLSHAVGCAFAICLERKQKRDTECKVSVTFDSENASFTRTGSFRQATITERLQDPQVLKPSQPPPPQQERPENPFAIARPHATDLMIQRQTSFRGFGIQPCGNSPFKRQLSLRLGDLPSTLERQVTSGYSISALDPIQSNTSESTLKSLEIVEEEAEAPDIPEMCQKLTIDLSVQPNLNNFNGVEKVKDHAIKEILSQRTGLAQSSLLPENISYSTVPIKPTQVLKVTPKPAESFQTKSSSNLDDFLSTVKPMEYDNPWDWVPDQPLKTAGKNSSSNCDMSSSGMSTTGSLNSFSKPKEVSTSTKIDNSPLSYNHSNFVMKSNQANMPQSLSFDQQLRNANSSEISQTSFQIDLDSSSGILEDPFDAEWAALAMRNTNSTAKINPFMNDKNESELKKAFELHM